MQEIITVSKVNQYGVRVGDKQYNKSQKYNGPDLTPGVTYDAEIYVSPKGARYINSAKVSENAAACSVSTQDAKSVTVSNLEILNSAASKTVSNGVDSKDAYWDKKNNSQLIGGLFHDAASITAALIGTLGLGKEEAIQTFEFVLKELISVRESLDK